MTITATALHKSTGIFALLCNQQVNVDLGLSKTVGRVVELGGGELSLQQTNGRPRPST